MLPSDMQFIERGWLSSNSLLLTGPDDTALVDSGYHTHAAQTLALVQHALQGRTLNTLINTHLHSDHCGGNAALQSAYVPASTSTGTKLARIFDSISLARSGLSMRNAREFSLPWPS